MGKHFWGKRVKCIQCGAILLVPMGPMPDAAKDEREAKNLGNQKFRPLAIGIAIGFGACLLFLTLLRSTNSNAERRIPPNLESNQGPIAIQQPLDKKLPVKVDAQPPAQTT